MKDLLTSLFQFALPPGPDATPEDERQWKMFISTSVIMVMASLATHIALACGFLVSIYPGFASAADLRALQVEWREYREVQSHAQILALRKEQCRSSGDARVLYTDALQKALLDYQKVSGRQYPLPACSDFPA